MKVFQYLPELDAFICTPEFKEVVGLLGLAEWLPCVWITRLLCMDNDYGEHAFDNWEEREALEPRIERLRYNIDDELLIVVPKRFADGRDGPCHSDELRKRFWTDLLKSLDVYIETIIVAAIEEDEKRKQRKWGGDPEGFDLSERITLVRAKYGHERI